MTKRKSLGRGLDALLSTSQRAAGPEASADQLKELPVDLLVRGKYQPRLDMREETLAELAESIRMQGIVQPLVVRPLPPEASGEQRYEIVAGERRWRAAQMAGLDVVPALVKDIPDEAAVAVALIENIQRENLNPVEESRSLKRLVEDFDMTHAQAAEAVGRSRVAVSNLLRLLDLPEPVRTMLERREIDMGHARALLGVESPERQLEIARRVVREAWNVRDTERAVRRLGEQSDKPPRGRGSRGPDKDPNVRRMEADLAEKLGAAVSIEHGTKGGRLVIRYHSLDELDGIVGHIQ